MAVVMSDLKNLINRYVECHSRLIPYYSFDQFVLKLEKVGTSRRVKECLCVLVIDDSDVVSDAALHSLESLFMSVKKSFDENEISESLLRDFQ